MCLTTSAKGLYHNLRDWRFEYCGDFKIMEQDRDKALEAFQLLTDKTLYEKLLNWNFNLCGGFRITKDDYEDVMSALKAVGNKEEAARLELAG